MEGIHTPKLQFMHAAMLVSVRKNSFTERVVKYWNRLLGEVVESPLKCSMNHMEVALIYMV